MQRVSIRPCAPEGLFRVGEVSQDHDRISASMDVGRWATGADGRPAVGALGVLADTVVGYALMASLDPGSWSISTEIWIDVVGPIPTEGTLIAAAVPVQDGSFARGRISTRSGRPVAECRQRGRYVEMPEGEPTDPDALVVPELHDARSLLGGDGAPDRSTLEVTPFLLNPRGMLHGGVSLAVSELLATHSRVQHGSRLPTTSVHIVHTRGVPVGARVELEVVHRHTGRTLWVTDVAGTVDGRLCTAARVTAQS